MESSSTELEAVAVPRDLLQAIGLALEELTSQNMSFGNDASDELTVFHAFSIPRVALRDYVMRIGFSASCSPECFVVAVVLLNRLLAYSPHIKLTLYTAHRLLATAVVLAVKSTDDYYFRNTYYASISGVSTRELNRLEVSFLSALQYDLHVSAAEFARYHERLMWYIVDSALQPDAVVLQTAAPLSPSSPAPWTAWSVPSCTAAATPLDDDDEHGIVTPAPNHTSWDDEGIVINSSCDSSPKPHEYIQYIVVAA